MKRTPMKRSPMKRRKRKPRPGLDDAKYLAWIRRQPCCVCTAPGPSHAHHTTGAGTGKKAHDRETMPLCAQHHRELHEFTGHFLIFTRNARAEWQRDMANFYRMKHIAFKGAA